MNQLDENLAHGKACYQNAQEVIRFVDSKTGVMTGVVTVTTGIPLAVFHFILSGKSDEAATIWAWIDQGGAPRWLVGLSASFLLLGFICGVWSLVAATSGLMARRPLNNLLQHPSLPKELGRLIWKIVTFGRGGKRPQKPPEITCLFPFFDEGRREEALKKFQKLGAGKYTADEILHEYGLQLGSVGSILATKINRNRKAVHWFEGQVAMYAVSTILSAALIFCYLPGRQPKKEPWDPTAPGHASITISSAPARLAVIQKDASQG